MYLQHIAKKVLQRSRLFTSFVTLVLTALVVSLIYYQHSLSIITASGEQASLTITHTFLNSLDDRLLDFTKQSVSDDQPLFESRQAAELDREIRRIMAKSGVVKIKIYNRSGLTVYSTDPSHIGEDQRHNPGFQRALKGSINSSMVYRNSFNSMDGVIEDIDLIQTYTPILAENGQATSMGVFELYTDVSPLVEELETSRFQVIITILVVSLILFLVHSWITWKSRRIITDQRYSIREKDRALEYSELLTRSLFDSIQERIILVSSAGKVLRVNRFAYQNSTVKLEHRNVMELFGDQLLDNEMSNAQQAIEKTLMDCIPQRGILTMDWQDKKRTLCLNTYPVMDANGCAHQALLYLRDITDEKDKEAQSCRQEKLISLGALAAGYAHELLNPIVSLSVELELLKQDASSPAIKKTVDTQGQLLERLNSIVNRMRDSFRSTQTESVATSVSDAIIETLQRVRSGAALHEISIGTHCPDDLPEALIARNHLVMVLCNLVNNAIQAMEHGGDITISAASLGSGSMQVLVKDTGPGMTAEAIDRSLGALYTTKQEGLGLGLTVSHELIRASGGQLTVESEVGQGTRIKILLVEGHKVVRDPNEPFHNKRSAI